MWIMHIIFRSLCENEIKLGNKCKSAIEFSDTLKFLGIEKVSKYKCLESMLNFSVEMHYPDRLYGYIFDS